MKISEAATHEEVIALDAWLSLAEAIVEQACWDYLQVLSGKCKSRENVLCRKEIEDFFHSEWFEILCALDGDAILHRLQDEHRCAGGRT